MDRKKNKHGFVLKMIPGNKKKKEKVAVLLTVVMFAISIALLLDIKNNFYNDAKAEAFAERVNNTQAK